MLLRGQALAHEVVLELFYGNYGALLVLLETWMPPLNTDLRFVNELLLEATEFAGVRVHDPPAIVLHGEVLKTDASIARTCKDEEGLAAEDDHVDTDIELAISVERRTFQIPLNYDFLEQSDLLFLLFLIRGLQLRFYLFLGR